MKVKYQNANSKTVQEFNSITNQRKVNFRKLLTNHFTQSTENPKTNKIK